jgi:hypothetical protein
MAKASLPNVTLLIAETRDHMLARMAVQDCLRQCEFGDVVICSNQFNELRIPGASYVMIEDWPDKIGWSKFHWHGTPDLVNTSHCLFIQWDSWVIDGGQWAPKWLELDYVGAPWWYNDNRNVGNGGFSLKSLELMEYLRANKDKFPVTTDADDDLLCRKYRHEMGFRPTFKWADNAAALDFAFERVRHDGHQKHFGFHGTFNWPWVLEYDDLMERMKFLRGDYCHKTGMLSELHLMIAAKMRNQEPWKKPHW